MQSDKATAVCMQPAYNRPSTNANCLAFSKPSSRGWRTISNYSRDGEADRRRWPRAVLPDFAARRVPYSQSPPVAPRCPPRSHTDPPRYAKLGGVSTAATECVIHPPPAAGVATAVVCRTARDFVRSRGQTRVERADWAQRDVKDPLRHECGRAEYPLNGQCVLFISIIPLTADRGVDASAARKQSGKLLPPRDARRIERRTERETNASLPMDEQEYGRPATISGRSHVTESRSELSSDTE